METARLTRSVTVVNDQGLHLRPAKLIVDCSRKYGSDIKIRLDQRTVDAKSVLDMLTLAADKGTILSIEAEGQDAQEAVRNLADLIEAGFGEPINGSVNAPT